MAKFVIKRSGEREIFDPMKIEESIRKAARDANLSEERIGDLIDKIATVIIETATKKEEITTSEIRTRILKELDILEPVVSEVWKKFEMEHQKIF
jgi:transcriptional regulator NrdR family protein